MRNGAWKTVRSCASRVVGRTGSSPWRPSKFLSVAIVICLAFEMGLPAMAFAADYRLRVSRVSGSALGPTDGGSLFPACSKDGRLVAYQSEARNLSSGAAPTIGIYITDRGNGAVRLLSGGYGGVPADGPSIAPSMSRSGAVVAFTTSATNFIEGDVNEALDVVAVHTGTGARTLVSRRADGTQANAESHSAAVSGDGKWVAFVSAATNLDGDAGDFDDVFLRHIGSGDLIRVSVTHDGRTPNGHSAAPSVSHDGRFVAFSSVASDLVPGDTNGASDVFVFDRFTSRIIRVSVRGSGGQANLGSFAPAISANGTRIAFESIATNLVSKDTNERRDVFVRDTSAGTTRRVSVGPRGQGNRESRGASISADGKRVGFVSGATNLGGTDKNSRPDLYVRDLSASVTKRVSAIKGVAAAGSSAGVVAPNGRNAVFHSEAANLVLYDANRLTDVFVASWGTRSYSRVAGKSLSATTVSASKRAFPSGARTVVLVNKDRWYEALPAASLAGARSGSLLYVGRTSLPSSVAGEIRRLRPDVVYVVGTKKSIGSAVTRALSRTVPGTRVVRISGKDRYALSAAIAAHVISAPGAFADGRVFVVSGTSFAHSAAVVPMAVSRGRPIVLANPKTGSVRLPSGTKRAIIIGGTVAVPKSVNRRLVRRLGSSRVSRIGDSDGLVTASRVNRWGLKTGRHTAERVVLTNIGRPSEAICAGVMAGRMGGVIAPVTRTAVPRTTARRLEAVATRVQTVYAFGPTRAVGSGAVRGAKKALGR